MAKSCKYYKQQRQVSYDNGVTWINLEEYRQGALIEVNSSDCTSPSTRIYRWAKAGTDDYVCVGYDKHYKEYYQYSTDNGATWQNVVPTSSRTSNDVIEYNSVDCGVTPQYIYRWVKTDITTCVENTDFKFKANYSNGTSYLVGCDSSSAVTMGITRPSGYEYTAMTSAIIGDCVTSIGSDAFEYCSGLTSCAIGDNVTNIGGWAFYYCTSLSSITIPVSVTSIGTSAFETCSGLTTCTFEEGSQLTNINSQAFWHCKSLTSIEIPTGVTSIGNGTFSDCLNLTSCTIGNNVTSIGQSAFANCNSLKRLNSDIDGVFNIPSGITTINYGVFIRCSGMTSVLIPTGVTSIGEAAFNDCRGLTNVTIPASVTTIGNQAFTSCVSLTSCTFAEGSQLTSIGANAFQHLINLTNITIPSGVTTIGAAGFGNCPNLISFTCLATTPPTLGDMAFYNYSSNFRIYVPSANVASYKSASGWSSFSSRIFAIS